MTFSLNDLRGYLRKDNEKQDTFAKIVSDRKKVVEDQKSCIIRYEGGRTKDDALGYTEPCNRKSNGGLGSEFRVVVNQDLDPDRKETVLIHELAHINQDTYDPMFLRSLKRVSTEFILKHDLGTGTHISVCDFVHRMHHQLANTMEDIRIESRESVDKIGNRRRFETIRRELGDKIAEVDTNSLINPAHLLLAVRFFNANLIKDPKIQAEFMQMHKDLEYQSHKGMLKIYKQVCIKYLHPWLLDKVKDFQEELNHNDDIKKDINDTYDDMSELQTEKEHKTDEIKEEMNNALNTKDYDSYYKARDKFEETCKAMNRKIGAKRGKVTRLKKNMKDVKVSIADTISGIDKKEVGATGSSMDEISIVSDMLGDMEQLEKSIVDADFSGSEIYSDDEIEETDLQEEQSNEYEKLKLNAQRIEKQHADEVTNVNDESDKMRDLWSVNDKLDSKLVAEIKRSVDAVTLKKPQLQYSGTALDLNQVIYSKMDKRTKIFTKKTDRIKLSMLFSIDCSGSMRGTTLLSCQEALLTMMTAVKNNPAVEVNCVGWSGDDQGNLYVRTAKTITEVKDRLGIYNDAQSTPTVAALQYTERMLRQMKGQKKVCIFFTDGMPSETSLSNVMYDPTEVYDMCSKQVKRIRNVGRIIPVVLGRAEKFEGIFKHGVISCLYGDDISSVLMKQWKKILMRELR